MVCVVLERYKQKSFWACTEPKFFSPPCPSALCCGVSRVAPPDAGRESQGYPIVSSQPGWVLLLRGIQSALSAVFLSLPGPFLGHPEAELGVPRCTSSSCSGLCCPGRSAHTARGWIPTSVLCAQLSCKNSLENASK